ncbi:MAG: hypothetical protein JW902_01225 [Syntrophaceae bacterium]|nr:hypothetical protein [Syntrophaceae bacterium]
MSIDLGNGKSVVSMTLTDLHTGKVSTLFERKGKRCHFHEDIYFENYIITLRVDWGDIRNTDPVLDADIYRDDSGNKGKKLRNGKWHHTSKQFNEDVNQVVYEFLFDQLKLMLVAKITFALSTGMGAILIKKE